MRIFLVLTLLCASAAAQAPAIPAPAFEVSTIKPSDPDHCCARTFSRNGRQFRTTNTNLKYLIQWAWNLQAKQVSGGPAWLDQDRFELAGQLEGSSNPTDRDWKIAVQNLLVERFHLQLHHETREMSAYLLVVAKGGPKLTPADSSPEHRHDIGFSGGVGQTMSGGGSNATLAEMTGELQRIVLDRPIVDHTGLTGRYNILLCFTREDPGATGTTPLPDNAAPGLFTALQDQLGLRLERGEGMVDILVIDHAEAPTPN